MAVPPGVNEVGRGGKVLKLSGAHQSARAWAGCWGGVVDGVDAVEVAAEEHCAVAVGGWQVIGEGGDEGEAWGLVAGRKEGYMYALAKPHGSCRGSSGSDMHKTNQNHDRDIKHPTT